MKPLPPQAIHHFQSGRAAELDGHWDLAIDAYRKALIFAPQAYPLLTNLANARWLAGQSVAAEATVREALRLAPGVPQLWRLWASTLRDLNRFEAADAAFRQAAAAGLNDPISAWNHSETLIALQRFEEAFALAERRLEEPTLGRSFHRPPPYWQGWAEATSVRIWSEQGLGDTLQFVRWIPMLRKQTTLPPQTHLILEVEAPLVNLLQRGLAWMPGPPEVVAKGGTGAPWHGCQGSLLSLPHLLGGAPLPLPGAYLLDPSWHRQPSHARERPRVGLVWASGRRLEDPLAERLYRRRSLPNDALVELLTGLQQQGADVVNLQVGADRQMASAWEGLFADALNPTADFSAMAGLMASLDLTITVDTAAAHLAGAIGHPGWVLLPWNADGRWLRQRHDSPWYPSLRLLRQPNPGDWPGLVKQVLMTFRQWLIADWQPNHE